MERRIIYIKADLNVIVNSQEVALGEIVKIYGKDTELIQRLKKSQILKIKENKHYKYAMTILKVIQEMEKQVPDAIILNEGESEFVIEYVPPHKDNKVVEIIKTIFICCAVFFGSAFTIMTFNQDVSVRDILSLFHDLVEENGKNNGIIEISYCIGLPIGIIVLFNHFSKKRMDIDPTPLQIQLRLFETNGNKAILEGSRHSGKTIDVE